MSTSILYHGFGIYGYRYVSSQYQQGTIVFTIEKEDCALRCPSCQGRHVCRRGSQVRWFHTLPIGRKQISSAKKPARERAMAQTSARRSRRLCQ